MSSQIVTAPQKKQEHDRITGKKQFQSSFQKKTRYLRDHYVTNVRRTYGRNPAPDLLSI